MNYYIIAGEASGDLHGSLLMRAIAKKDPDAEFRYWGGEKMDAACPIARGVKVCDISELSVMGVVEVVAKVGRLRRKMASCKADIARFKPDALILIDYPGFNLKMAEFAHKRGLKVFYYIAPKVWATREKRVKQLQRYVDRLYAIFPFEVEWFRSRGVDVVYEGNPLVEHIDARLEKAYDREKFLSAYGLEDKPLIALLPGSRPQELKFLAHRFVAASQILKRPDSPLRDCQFVVAAAPGIDASIYDSYFEGTGVKVLYDNNYTLLKYADAAAVASGTASLEAAVIGCPQVVCYGMNPLSYKIATSMLKVNYVSLANLIMDRQVCKELLQDECNPSPIAAELIRLTQDEPYRAEMLRQYTELRHMLEGSGAADRIASDILKSVTD